MAVVIILNNYYFRIIITNLTKCNVSSTFALQNYEKFTDYNSEKLRLRFLALVSTILVFGLKRVCPQKSVLGLEFFFELLALALTSKVVPSTSPLTVTTVTTCNSECLLHCNYCSFSSPLLTLENPDFCSSRKP